MENLIIKEFAEEPTFIIDPWYVRSKNDNDVHYISAIQLIYLYGIHPRWKTIIIKDEHSTRGVDLDDPKYIYITSKSLGDYHRFIYNGKVDKLPISIRNLVKNHHFNLPWCTLQLIR